MLLATGADARTRAGDKLLKEGQQAEIRKEWDKALEFYEKALSSDPSDPGYQLSTKRVRFQAAMARVDLGQKIREQGKLEEAFTEFQKAYAIDPSSSIALQEMKRTKEMIDKDKGQPHSANPTDRGLTPTQRAQKETDERSGRILPPPELKPITRQIATLKMNNQPVKVLYETVGKLAGINVIFDPDYQPPPGKSTFTIDLSNTTLEEALDYLAIQTKSYWKPLSSNTIFVTSDNVTKRRDYEDYVVKVFYIKNATTVQELQEISTTVRSVTEIRRAFTYNAQNAILMRGTADQMALAEKLIADLDKPKPEVVIDVVVMEADRARVKDLAATMTTGGAAGIKIPIGYTSSADGKSTTVNLNSIRNIGSSDFSFAVPGGLLQAVATDSMTRVLQQPQLRAVDNGKATLKIGDKIPYATGSFGSAIGGAVGGGVSPLVSTQFNFAEVGVNVDIVPKIHGTDEVSMHVDVEVSNVNRYVKIGDLDQPVISQKHIVHDIRLREGEVNLLGGLMQHQDAKSLAGIPGLMNIPIIGHFFGTDHTEKSQGELLIALIPHIVRTPDLNDNNLKAIASGVDQTVKLSYAPRKDNSIPAPAAPAVPAGAPTPAPAVTPAPAQGPPPATAPKPPADAAAAAPAGPFAIVPASPTIETKQGENFNVVVNVQNAKDLYGVPLQFRFDPKLVKLVNARAGTFLGKDGEPPMMNNIVQDEGVMYTNLMRSPNSAGLDGSGELVVYTFQALQQGSATITMPDARVFHKTSDAEPFKGATVTVNVK